MAAAARRFQSPAKVLYMRLAAALAALATDLLARAGHLELAAGADNWAAQRQLLGPRILAAAVAVRMKTMRGIGTMRLAQGRAALW
jgi:hypothetical protein